MIKIENVTKIYDEKIILKDINFKIEKGIIALVGNNATGKSTLLRILAGIEPISQGKILIKNYEKRYIDLHKNNNMKYFNIAFLGENETFLEESNVYQNIVLGKEKVKYGFFKDDLKTEGLVYDLMDKYHIRLNIYKKVAHLTVEERKKLGLLRVLFKKPQILLLDEPMIGLSREQKTQFGVIFNNLKKENLTVIFTSKDSLFANSVAEKIAYFSDNGILSFLKNVNEKAWKSYNNYKIIDMKIKKDKSKKNNKKPLLAVKNLSFYYDYIKLENFSFNVYENEIYGIYDVENAYSDLITEALFNMRLNSKETVLYKNENIENYLTDKIRKKGLNFMPDRFYEKMFISTYSLLQNFSFWNYKNQINIPQNTGILKIFKIKNKLRTILNDYQLKYENDDLTNKLSLGDLQKFLLGCIFSTNSELLFLNNPFSHLDKININLIIEKMLQHQKEKNKAIVIISSDPYILKKLCSRVSIIYKGKCWNELEGKDVIVKNMINLK